MGNETKTPERDEWWLYNANHNCRLFIVGANSSGHMVGEDRDGNYEVFDGRGNMAVEFWHHEPRCTGFDWEEPPAIDPGEGWELLKNGEVINVADEYFDKHNQKWCRTISGGLKVGGQFTAGAYRRRKPPAEVWPKYYVHSDATWRWYIKRLSESMSEHVSDDGIEDLEDDWGLYQDSLVESGAWIEVTEAEALARVKPTAETWPKWYVPRDLSTPVYVKKTCSVKADFTSSDIGTISNVPVRLDDHHWLEVTESEAKARVKPADPLPALIPGIATDRMVDLFLSWRLPSDFQPDGGISFISRPLLDTWPTGTNLFTSTQARAMLNHVLSVPADSDAVSRRPNSGQYDADLSEGSPGMALETAKQWLEDNPEDPPPFANPFTNSRSGTGIPKNNAPVELPDDWVDLPETHILRADIDQVLYEHDTINYWQEVCPSAGMRLNDSQYKRARCRRRDLPAQPAPIDHERWFMWSDDRYPIAFVKRAGGKVFNLNVDGMFKTSDDWGASYEEKLINGELIEVTEESAKAYLKRPRRKIIDPPAPQPKRTPVRLWHNPDSEDGMVFVSDVRVLAEDQEIKCGPSGFYVEEVSDGNY